jgi:hypothetical protein
MVFEWRQKGLKKTNKMKMTDWKYHVGIPIQNSRPFMCIWKDVDTEREISLLWNEQNVAMGFLPIWLVLILILEELDEKSVVRFTCGWTCSSGKNTVQEIEFRKIFLEH